MQLQQGADELRYLRLVVLPQPTQGAPRGYPVHRYPEELLELATRLGRSGSDGHGSGGAGSGGHGWVLGQNRSAGKDQSFLCPFHFPLRSLPYVIGKSSIGTTQLET